MCRSFLNNLPSFIDLEELPGVVAKKWLLKKKRMLEVVAKVNGEEIKQPSAEENQDSNRGYSDEVAKRVDQVFFLLCDHVCYYMHA